MRIVRVVLATCLVCGFAYPAISSERSVWTLRFHGAMVESSGAEDASLVNGASISIDVGGGLGVAAEYRLSKRFGLEFSALFAGLEVSNRVSARTATFQSTELNMLPLTLGFPIHIGTGSRVDLFVAPTLSLVRYSGVDVTFEGFHLASTVGTDSDIGVGASLGLDVPFRTGKWAFSTGLRYVKTGTEKTAIDPVIVTIGCAYRF